MLSKDKNPLSPAVLSKIDESKLGVGDGATCQQTIQKPYSIYHSLWLSLHLSLSMQQLLSDSVSIKADDANSSIVAVVDELELLLLEAWEYLVTLPEYDHLHLLPDIVKTDLRVKLPGLIRSGIFIYFLFVSHRSFFIVTLALLYVHICGITNVIVYLWQSIRADCLFVNKSCTDLNFKCRFC